MIRWAIPLTQLLREAVKGLPQNVIRNATENRAASQKQGNMRVAGQGGTPGALFESAPLKPGTLVQREDGSIGIVGTKTENDDIQKPRHQRLAVDFMRVRDTRNELFQILL